MNKALVAICLVGLLALVQSQTMITMPVNTQMIVTGDAVVPADTDFGPNGQLLVTGSLTFNAGVTLACTGRGTGNPLGSAQSVVLNAGVMINLTYAAPGIAPPIGQSIQLISSTDPMTGPTPTVSAINATSPLGVAVATTTTSVSVTLSVPSSAPIGTPTTSVPTSLPTPAPPTAMATTTNAPTTAATQPPRNTGASNKSAWGIAFLTLSTLLIAH